MRKFTDDVPIFPLSTVFFPDGFLSLNVFEARYLEMVSYCLKHDVPFGICLIVEGNEVGKAAHSYRVGTLAKIINWGQTDKGVLSIDVLGCQRFKLLESKIRPNQLVKAKIRVMEPVAPVVIPDDLKQLTGILQRFLNSRPSNISFHQEQLEDATWVGYRLTEVLPVENVIRQKLLEMDDPIERLHRLLGLFSSL